MRLDRVLLLAAAVAVWGSSASAQTSAIPQLSSRPGAAYTVYLNFGGFTFNGNWGGTLGDPSDVPGTTPAYDTSGDSSVFTATEITQMRQIWSRTAEAYAPFNVNITTVTPPAAPASDFNRQAFYDGQAQLIHTVIGGNGSWLPGPIGVSFTDVASESFPTTLNGQLQNGGAGAGLHTNWTFSSRIASFYSNVPQATALTTIHENGHAFGMNYHQSVTETSDRGAILSTGLANPPKTRTLWVRSGGLNDVAVIVNNPNMGGYAESGVGHTRPTATVLPMTGTSINFNQAKGHIAPTNTNPNPLGEANYTTDFFQFVVGAEGANVNVTLRSGRTDSGLATDGTADPGAMLDAIFRLLNADGSVLQTSNASVFTETITSNNLPQGTYYFQISSAGADPTFFDMGSYFLTGSIVPVPEPGLVLLAGAVGLGLRSVVRRRRRAAQV